MRSTLSKEALRARAKKGWETRRAKNRTLSQHCRIEEPNKALPVVINHAHPRDNIYWRDIRHGDRVIETATLFIVERAACKGTNTEALRAVAFWEGKDAVVAQAFLRRKANGQTK